MTNDLNLTEGFGADALKPVPFEHALRRLRSFLTAPHSGWVSYDLSSVHPRASGYFDSVTPWSLLLANALAGQVSISNVASFDHDQRSKFAERVSAVPTDVDLAGASSDEMTAICMLARTGFRGAWGPKITKLAALYRPAAMPVLDGHVATAFGYKRNAYTSGAKPRHEAINRTIGQIAAWLDANRVIVDGLRAGSTDLVPAEVHVTDVRLIDIVLWTSQDDQFDRPGSKRDAWLNRPEGSKIELNLVEPVRIHSRSRHDN